MKLVFFLEERSAEEFLRQFVPRVLPLLMPKMADVCETQYIVFQGKSDLDKKLERRLRGWNESDCYFVVLRDRDSADCRVVKKTMTQKCYQANHSDVLVRIACCEMERWFLGDLRAVETAMQMPGIAKRQNNRKFRQPDNLNNAAEELEKLTQDTYQKISGSRSIGKHLCCEPSQNRSRSFQVFVQGLQRLLERMYIKAGNPN